jgi:hypothetical protein
MKLNFFISQVLQDIESGLNVAKEKNDKKYFINTQNSGGVDFDIAVTTVNGTDTEIEGSAKAGIIEVLGAGVKGKITNKEGNSEVSRIKFTVFVPHQTKQESEIESTRTREQNEVNRNKYNY